jgi:predicted ATPase
MCYLSPRTFCYPSPKSKHLDPLGGQSADEMLLALLGGDTSLPSLKRLIIDKTQGNPFFMEEIVRALVEQGVLVRNGATRLTKPLTEIHVPPTVHGILASRIDALPASQKDVLQTLAVIGKDFPLNLVRHITASPDDRLEPILKGLQAGEFIYERPAFGEAEYTFKHMLTQEVAYNSVLMERRRLLHERTGEAIEALFKERVDDHLAELAHHYSRSANTRKAVEYLFRAGSQAAARSAYPEAITRLSSALEFLKHLADDTERARQELSVQIRLRRKSCQCKRLRGGGIGACVCENARVVRANPRPRSRLPSPFWTMVNAFLEAGAAHRFGARR